MGEMSRKDAMDYLKELSLRLNPCHAKQLNDAITTLEKDAHIHDLICYREPCTYDPKLHDLFRKVEDALGFKLFFWQKTYIDQGCFRGFGKTTAEILRELLTDVDVEPLDYSEFPSSKIDNFYKMEMKEIKEKLDAAGIKTRKVYFSKADKAEDRKREDADVLRDVYSSMMQTAKNFDIFLEECLKPYGITKENANEWTDRVFVVMSGAGFNIPNVQYYWYFIDNIYAFTIRKITENISANEGRSCSKITVKYEKIIESSMEGKRYDETKR